MGKLPLKGTVLKLGFHLVEKLLFFKVLLLFTCI